ncbi:SigE family RNA polymerase sigma factor [Ornithinimicrobium cerasi]|uniref:RNA polymerase sigma-70 factor, sigma-E family n=1 Tax=Ornithinimicrobium cerasi TaxID=2248773 RepID=A0A285VCJ9_9MICO|nr:SigE family RNA polymerase sigma factor [Ornithinimicrobium cerasi]SOC51780.1 RNA polymerase sigma-70 factor, sigma-E family [Ornithinimicrobium cerasi]
MGIPVDDDFAAFVRSRQRGLLRAAYLVCGDVDQAQDLVQDAFAKLSSRWDSVRDGSPDAYVRRIVYHDAVSGWRRWGRRHTVTEPAEVGALLERHTANDPVVDWVDGADVRQALGELPSRQRAVIVLRYYEDLSEAQIADALGVAPGTVKTLARGALINLRRLLPALTSVLSTEGGDPR